MKEAAVFKLHDPLSRRLKILFSVAGAFLLVTGVALGFLALAIAGGGHVWPFSGSTDDVMFASALLSLPATIIATGLALLRPNAARVGIAAGIALLLPVDAAIIAGAIWHLNRPEPPVSIPLRDSHAVITGAVLVPPTPIHQPVPIDCGREEGAGKSVGRGCDDARVDS
jgi:hypothetical protein